MVCYDLLIDVKLRDYCNNCKLSGYCWREQGKFDICDFGIYNVAKELGM